LLYHCIDGFYTISFLTHKHHLPHTKGEVIFMAKKGVNRPEPELRKKPILPVPEISGKVYHSIPHAEDTIPTAFPAIDNDLAVDNLLNDFDMTAADLHDLQ